MAIRRHQTQPPPTIQRIPPFRAPPKLPYRVIEESRLSMLYYVTAKDFENRLQDLAARMYIQNINKDNDVDATRAHATSDDEETHKDSKDLRVVRRRYKQLVRGVRGVNDNFVRRVMESRARQRQLIKARSGDVIMEEDEEDEQFVDAEEGVEKEVLPNADGGAEKDGNASEDEEVDVTGLNEAELDEMIRDGVDWE